MCLQALNFCLLKMFPFFFDEVIHSHRRQTDNFSKSQVLSSSTQTLPLTSANPLFCPIFLSKCLVLLHFHLICIAFIKALTISCLKHCKGFFYSLVVTLPSELLPDTSQKLSVVLITIQWDSLPSMMWPQPSVLALSYLLCQSCAKWVTCNPLHVSWTATFGGLFPFSSYLTVIPSLQAHSENLCWFSSFPMLCQS